MILNGWKEIAAYVNSSVRTVQRWERAGMPVARPLPSLRGSVIARSEQLDSWFGRRSEVQTVTAPLPSLTFMLSTRRDLHEAHAHAVELTQQIQQTKLEMKVRMNLLQAEVALLKENLIRLSLVRNPANVTFPVTVAMELNWLQWSEQPPRVA
jgi:phage terminase Nu1 subunit (DNA packaging protein)